MRNLLVEMAFNGAPYHGFQVQENAFSVMECVQDVMEEVFGRRDGISGCSRTDTGVHANSYYFHVRTELNIPCDRFLRAMNHKLPSDIVLLSCREVPLEFHARYDSKGKEYIYRIHNARVKDPFLADFVLFCKTPIDEKKLDEAAQALVGTHDFSAFCSAGGKLGRKAKPGATNVRTVRELHVTRQGSFVEVRIRADGFLYHMVRIIVGTLLSVNEGKIAAEELPEIIAGKDRRKAGRTVPPQGLYLNRVEYDLPLGENCIFASDL